MLLLIFYSLLKIWNLNKLTGVIGVFNCQGAGSWPMKPLESTPTRLTISGKIRPIDVEFLEEVAGENWNGDCILYAFNAGPILNFTKFILCKIFRN
jgi:raffinose synthase